MAINNTVENINNQPTIEPQTVTGAFLRYIAKTIPLAFDESMSYYECICALRDYINGFIDNLNNVNEGLSELQTFYLELQSYVNNYFDNLDVQEEINKKLDDMTESGELTTLIGSYVQPIQTAFENEVRGTLNNMQTQINSVASGSPSGTYATTAALTSADPDHSKIYVVLEDGKWYYYNTSNSTWTAGGVYQGTTVQDESITLDKLNDDIKFNLNERTIKQYDYEINNEFKVDLSNSNLINAIVLSDTGKIENRTDLKYYSTEYYTYIPEGAIINLGLHPLWTIFLYYYDEDFNYISYFPISNTTTSYTIVNTIKTARYVRFRFSLKSNEETTTSDIISEFTDLKIVNINNLFKTSIGTNMFNPYKYYTGYLMGTGNNPYNIVQLENTTYRTTYPIKVKANTTYYISRFRQFILLDNNFQYVSGSVINTDTQNHTFTPASDGYVVFSYNQPYASSLIMAQSSTPVSYVPYKEYLPDYIDLSNIIESDNSDVLYGKKYVALGDSFTHGDFSNSPTADYTITEGIYTGQYKVYPFLIGNRTNMQVTNLAQNGMTITNINGTSNNYLSDSILEQIPEDVNYITIKIGINDNPDHQNAPLGTIQSTDRKTFYGAWNYVIEYLITNYPNAKIGIIVSNGMSDIDYVNAELNIAKRYGISFINETTDNNVPLLIRTLRTDVLQSIKNLRDTEWEVLRGTNGHPNAKCHEYESTIIENFLRTL